MKKLSLLLAAVLLLCTCLTLASCGGSETTSSAVSSDASVSDASSEEASSTEETSSVEEPSSEEPSADEPSSEEPSTDVSGDIEVPDDAQTFWLTHYNDSSSEGAGAVFTAEYTGANWWIHFAFAPVEGSNAYEIVDLVDGLRDGSGYPLNIPEGGFVYAFNIGNDYPSLGAGYEGKPCYVSEGGKAMMSILTTWQIGDKFVFSGLDLEGLTVPTSTPDVEWYDPSYVCTAKFLPVD